MSFRQFKAIEDRATDGAIELREQVGLDVITDGEMRRGVFVDSVAAAVEGVTPTRRTGQSVVWHGGPDQQDDTVAEWRLGVTGKVRAGRSIVTEEYVYARAKARKPVKVTLPSPMTLTLLWHPEFTPDVYPDTFDLYADLAKVVRQEVLALAELGCTYIQIDAPDLAKLVDDEGRRFFADAGADPDRVLTDGVDLLNDIVRGIDVTFGMHLCRGNSKGRWRSSGGYEAISKEVFRRATEYNCFLLEYDDERSGGSPDLPDDKVAVLGLVTTKRPDLELRDALARIEEAAKYFPKEQLAPSPQCGFASEVAGNPASCSGSLALVLHRLDLLPAAVGRWPRRGRRSS